MGKEIHIQTLRGEFEFLKMKSLNRFLIILQELC